jgi:CubicO group peptidase (beta-lactamase class C family)
MTRSHRLSIAVIVLISIALVAGSTRAAAATPADGRVAAVLLSSGPSDPVELVAFLDEFLYAQLAREHIAGAAVAVVRDGALLAARGYGYADLATRTPVVADQTIFATGSAGKLFTWTAVMQLVEQGVLDLDTDVNTYLDFTIPATYPAPITLRHLLSHTAGFDELAGIYTGRQHELVSQGLYLASQLPARVRAPGALSAYSNYGAALAGYIVERATGTTFEQYVEDHLFAPLQMHHSTFRQPLPPDFTAAVSTGYQYTNDAYQVVPPAAIRMPAAGASHTTVTDMAHFMIAHLQDGRYEARQILQPATTRQMHQRLFAHDPRVNGMAYGFAEVMLNQQRILKHNGAMPRSFNTLLALLPEQGIGIYVSYNTGGATPGEQLLQAFVNRYYPTDLVAPAPVAAAQQVAAHMAGTYRSTRAAQTTLAKVLTLASPAYADIQVVAAPDGSVTTTGIGPQRLRWIPVAPDVLRLADGRQDSYGDLVFGADAAGALTRLYVQNNPYRAAERILWYETSGFFLGVLGVCTLAFLSAALGWPLATLLRRWRAPAAPIPRLIRATRWLAGAAAVLYLLFLPGLLMTIGAALDQGATAALLAVLTLPLLGSMLLAGSCVAALRSWPRAGWGIAARADYALVVLAGVGYLWLLNTWNLLGFRF